MLFRVDNETEINAPRDHRVAHRRRRAVPQRDLDRRGLVQEARHHGWQEISPQRLVASDHEAACLLVLDAKDLALRARQHLEHLVRVAHQLVAGLGERDAVAVAQEQLRAELRLQALHRDGDRGLAHAERLGRRRHRALLGDRLEIPKIRQLHARSGRPLGVPSSGAIPNIGGAALTRFGPGAYPARTAGVVTGRRAVPAALRARRRK